MTAKTTRLAQMIFDRQIELALTDSACGTLCGGASQQTFNHWTKGVVPRKDKRAAIADFLGIPHEEMDALVEEALADSGAEKLPRMGAFGRSQTYGKIIDRKQGKFREPIFSSYLPKGRYAVRVDTKVMEPSLRVGLKAYVDPAFFAQVGDDVIVHVEDGFFWIGRLLHFTESEAKISQYEGKEIELKRVRAIHPIVLAERV